MHPRTLAALVSPAIVVAGLALTAPPAAAAFGCDARQLTTDVNPSRKAISGDGDIIAFTSDEDPLGLNADGSPEVFTFDVVQGDIEQLTDLDTDDEIQDRAVDVDDDGGVIVFASTADLTGSNADGNLEVFVLTEDNPFPVGLALLQVTNTTGGVGSGSSTAIDASGDHVAFTSDRNLDATNADGNGEVFVADVDFFGSTVEQVTATTGGGANAHADVDISAEGGHVAYTSTRNPTGGNADGNADVFRTTVATETATQLTATTTGETSGPSIDGNGNRVVFQSTSQDLGTNADGQPEVYLRRITPGSTTRLTDSATDDQREPQISADGEVVVYETTDDLVPAVHHRVASGTATTITTAGAEQAAVDADGDRIAMEVEGADGGEELGLAVCLDPTFTDVGITHPFLLPIEWMATEEISTGFEPGPTYRPSTAVTRQAMSAFMFRLADVDDFEDPPTSTFTDIGPGHPFFTEIEWMAATGISEGFLPGPTYRPAAAVSRAAMSAFMFRLAGEPTFPDPVDPTFSDVSGAHPFFHEIEWMAFARITIGFGDGTYRPSAAVSRQAMSAFMQRLALRVGFDS